MRGAELLGLMDLGGLLVLISTRFHITIGDWHRRCGSGIQLFLIATRRYLKRLDALTCIFLRVFVPESSGLMLHKSPD